MRFTDSILIIYNLLRTPQKNKGMLFWTRNYCFLLIWESI